MTASPRVLVLRAAGTNCDPETARVFEQVGATATIAHLNRLIETPDMLGEADILAIPGGFSYGDDIGSGKIFAIELRERVTDALRAFLDKGGLVLGICNGFQVLIKAGLLPGGASGLATGNGNGQPATATVTWNDCRHYVCQWVHVAVDAPADSPFLRGIERMWLPIAHAEGKFVAPDAELDALEAGSHTVLRYIDPGTGEQALTPPHNPAGSLRAIAGITDTTGRILGLMPHPERHSQVWHRPDWTRLRATRKLPEEGDGLTIFRNAVDYVKG